MPLKRQMQEVGARDCHKSTDWLRGPHRDLLEQVPKKRSDDSFHIDALQAQKQAPQHAFTSIAQRDNTKPSQKLDGEFWRADCLESTIDQDVQHWLCAPPCSPFAINGTSDSAGTAQHGDKERESVEAQKLDRSRVQIGACFEPGAQAARSLAPGQSSVADWLVISDFRLVRVATFFCTECKTSNEQEFAKTPRTRCMLVCEICGYQRAETEKTNDVVRRVRDTAWHSDEAVSRASTDASPRLHAQAEFAGGHSEWSQLEILPQPLNSPHLRENRGTGIQLGQFSHNDNLHNPLLVKRELELLMDFGNSPVKERHKLRISTPPRHSEDLGLQKALEVAPWAQRVNSSSSEKLGRARLGAIVSSPGYGAKGY